MAISTLLWCSWLQACGGHILVEEPGLKNVKNKHLGMPPFKQNFHLFYPLVHSIGCMKPDIAINLSLANLPVTVCLMRYPSFS